MSDRQTPNLGPEESEEPLRIPDVKGSIDTIIVPVDGSAGSEKGLAYADLLAGMTGARVVVVVAFDPPLTIRRRGILGVEHARAEMEQEAKDLAAEAAELMIERGHRADAVVVRGDPASAILETADQEHADLIVMGRRGLGPLAGVLLGSVSERVARHSDVPVLLAH